MATGSGQAASPALGEEDLAKLHEALYSISPKYKLFGLQIGVLMSEIRIIEAKYSDPGERLLEVLSIRINKSDPLTWDEIEKALRSASVSENKVANEVMGKLCRPISCSKNISNQESEETVRKKTRAGMEAKTEKLTGHDQLLAQVKSREVKVDIAEASEEKLLVSGLEHIRREERESGDSDQSDPVGRGQDQVGHDIQRSRKRHRESSSSSPSASQEHPDCRQKRMKKEHGSCCRKRKRDRVSISSDTDDSSESNILKNISSTKMIKVFKRFFGRLCYAIKNPVEIATLFQMKGLISVSIMNELLRSPESNQEKAIMLVEALYKRIKPRPDRIFTVVEVLLRHEALLGTGEEMWIEIGNTYPNHYK